jgi:transcriptional regulator with XRE-family HTH domain
MMDYKRLKGIRKFKKITLKELSKQTGIHRNSLAKIENGLGNPTGETLDRIIKALDANIIISL